ncbi:hypothetical protein TRAPUB_12634 [Trametes pubescens]|uniref:Uncharacterized protein n=1 Tax=Trametes pubescens TaxID=154538 RepID=A0A1M2VTG6_TRAPU|nr:hypothetical protein TRAPUB_12634 [Trametes pubescens]
MASENKHVFDGSNRVVARRSPRIAQPLSERKLDFFSRLPPSHAAELEPDRVQKEAARDTARTGLLARSGDRAARWE